VDDELPNAFVELNYPLPVEDPSTIGALRREVAFGIGMNIVITRLQEDALRGEVPFFDPSFAANPLVRAQQSPGLATSAEPEELAAATEGLLTEVERAIRFGFSEDELNRAVTDFRQSVDLALASADSTQDWEFASYYVQHYLGTTPIPDAQTAHDISSEILDQMTVGQVADTFRATVTATEPLIIVAGPAAAADVIPTDAELMAIYTTVLTSEIEPRQDTGEIADGLMAAPAPVDIVSRSELFPLDITVLELENGVTLAHLQTDIAAGFVTFGAISAGGWSIAPDADVTETQYGPGIVARSGVAGFDQVELERILSGTTAGAAPYVDITSEGWFGGAATGDLEILFQLVHLYMTRPRLDPAAFEIFDSEVRPLV
ncbi:MAG: hypothetical protein HKN01_03770, partial [Acidimicrobiia bacterium]|nr:hypothetical protein [Acidimicrobiia bacterium]